MVARQDADMIVGGVARDLAAQERDRRRVEQWIALRRCARRSRHAKEDDCSGHARCPE